MKRSRALLTTALPIALVTALALTGCSAGSDVANGGNGSGEGNGTTTAGDCVASGAASDAVKVEGEPGGELTLTIGDMPKASGIERTVVTEGEGEQAQTGQGVVVVSSAFNGNDGSLLQALPAQGIVLTEGEQQLAPWDNAAAACAVPGQRVVLAGTAADFSLQADQIGLTDDDNLVFVTDVLGVEDLLPKAEGEAKPATESYPTVELADDGAPEITVPKDAKAPEKLSIETLIEGAGDEVQSGDIVFVNYRGIIWSTGEEFDSSWSRGTPIAFPTTGVIGGFKEALEGKTVGSQIISVVPAEDGGYGGAQLESMGHKADDVMVFVLDILGTVHVPAAE